MVVLERGAYPWAHSRISVGTVGTFRLLFGRRLQTHRCSRFCAWKFRGSGFEFVSKPWPIYEGMNMENTFTLISLSSTIRTWGCPSSGWEAGCLGVEMSGDEFFGVGCWTCMTEGLVGVSSSICLWLGGAQDFFKASMTFRGPILWEVSTFLFQVESGQAHTAESRRWPSRLS